MSSINLERYFLKKERQYLQEIDKLKQQLKGKQRFQVIHTPGPDRKVIRCKPVIGKYQLYRLEHDRFVLHDTLEISTEVNVKRVS